jgi:hypothetical protein
VVVVGGPMSVAKGLAPNSGRLGLALGLGSTSVPTRHKRGGAGRAEPV